MIVGRRDTWYTLEEFAAMIGRDAKTVANWASTGRLMFASLLGVRMVALSTIENLIDGHVPEGAADGQMALRLANRLTPEGHRVAPEKRRRNRAATT